MGGPPGHLAGGMVAVRPASVKAHGLSVVGYFYGKSRPKAHFYIICGTPELDSPHYYTAALHTGLSNGFSRKLENHAAAVALNYFAYNFIRIHRTLRVSPAMAAGVADRLWDVNDLVALWESYERRAERAA